ncbi:MAG: glycosyltransferase [Puniceicoccales bacterium]|nr:glycosyltransferase [Puniceicoccales bacterium]
MLLSVIVPIYCKPPQFLRECIESILRQTLNDFELILIDDASPDNPMELLEGYAFRDRRIKLIHLPQNRGVAAARNAGLHIARGKYISFIDADDIVDASYFETLITIAEQFSLDIVAAHTNDFRTTEQLKPIHPFRLDIKIKNIPLRRLSVQHFICRLFRRSVIKSLAFDERLHTGEDILFIHWAMFVATRCIEIRYCGYYYRHPSEHLMQNYCKNFITFPNEQVSLGKKISEMLHLIAQFCELKKFSKNREDTKFIHYFSLRRFLRYSNFIWKLEGKKDQEIYWQKFCVLFFEKFFGEMREIFCFTTYIRWIFSRPSPFWGIRFFLYLARAFWELYHVEQNFYRLVRIFRLAWKGYVC